ncbi:MAG: GNAT family N-acetyltransferase [Actinomycetota bacterium]|nr:GNAT family N-acetyltransferase [Actinomycetota bacterium]
MIPEYRHKKIGKSLMSFLASQAVSRGYKNLEFSVLDWNQKAISFYHRLGATRKDEWLNYNIEGKNLWSLAHISCPLP